MLVFCSFALLSTVNYLALFWTPAHRQICLFILLCSLINLYKFLLSHYFSNNAICLSSILALTVIQTNF